MVLTLKSRVKSQYSMKNALNKIYYVSKNHCAQGAERRGSSAWSERSTHNRKAAGSSPASGT